ncbi:MAG: hypothetical protein B9S33_19825 [Pedosphaera sp. Tous-C6FEB]|nr:MAG: hypothetical protein B9S33_19825 [Pedosphaera sp. Tous-C6FEB]
MKTHRLTQLLSLSAVLLALATAASAQSLIRFESQPGSKMRMDGTSTVHAWHAESMLIGGFIELDAALVEAPDKAKPGKFTAKGETFIAVRSLKCSSGKPMDAVMQEAMKEKENPRITFKLVELTLKDVKGAAVNFDAKGTLTVSGVTKEILLPVTMLRRVDQSRVTFSGTTSLKMTDFKITPPAPTSALGLIKTGDDVKLTFEWVVGKKDAAK